MLNNKIKTIAAVLFVILITGLITAQENEMSQDEYEIIKDQYAVEIIILMTKNDSLDGEISALKEKSSDVDAQIEYLESELYSLVGTTRSGVNDFRRKFEETEKRINGRTGTPADARRMYYDEILAGKIRCMPEFADRFASMRKQMTDWEGIQTTVVAQETAQIPEGTYLVVKGDCLWKISALKYGSPYYWPAIWEANKNSVVNRDEFFDYRHKAITDPNLIYPGQVLKIPSLNTDQSLQREGYKERIKKFRKIRKKEQKP